MNPERQAKIKERAKEGREQQNFTKPLTGPRAQHIAKAETNLAYGQTQRQNKALIRGSRQQEKRVGGWYDTFANEIAASRGEVANAYGQANQAIAGNIQTGAADDAARQAALAQQGQQFSQLTGAPQTPGPAQTDAAAQGQRQLYGAALSAPVAAQGANAFAYLTNQKSTAKGEGINQKIKEHKRGLGYQEDRTALLKEKGNYRATKLDELRKAERDYAIQKAAVNMEGKKFGAEQSAGAAEAAEKARQQEIENQFKERELGQEGRKINNENKPGAKSPSERNEAREGRQNAWAAANQLYSAATKPPTTSQGWAAFAHLLAAESEVSPAEAQWAVRRLRQKIENENVGTGTAQGHVHR